MAKRKLPHGSKWRISARDFDGENRLRYETASGPVMDEIVIDEWFHLEQLTECDWYLYVGGVRLDVHLDKAGIASVMLNGEPVDEEVYQPDKRKPRDKRQDLLDRVNRLKAATERAQEQFGLAMIDPRPLTEREQRKASDFAETLKPLPFRPWCRDDCTCFECCSTPCTGCGKMVSPGYQQCFPCREATQ